MTDSPILSVSHLKKSFGEHEVLRDISFDVQQGDVVSIIGASGSGKSTLLRCINFLEQPTAGTILFQGKNAETHWSRAQYHAKVGMVFQSFNLFGNMSVLKNCVVGQVKVLGRARREAEEKALMYLEKVGMAPYRDARPAQLSGGQQQRVAIARAVVNKPLVLLLDEPFSALDYKLRRAMQLEIKRLQRRLGITFVFVTHDQEEAFAMSDRVVVMNQGRIEQIGTPQEIYEEPSNLYVARFVGEINILPARIMSVPGEGIYIADISGRRFTLRTSRPFAAGDRVNVLLRPEDIRVYAHDDERPEGPYLTGRIEETVYKGATVDISIALDSGETLSVAEFFNEDDAEISYNRGERVAVTWVDGWEVVLPYEAD